VVNEKGVEMRYLTLLLVLICGTAWADTLDEVLEEGTLYMLGSVPQDITLDNVYWFCELNEEFFILKVKGNEQLGNGKLFRIKTEELCD